MCFLKAFAVEKVYVHRCWSLKKKVCNFNEHRWPSLSLHRAFCSLFKQHTNKCTYI